MKKTITLNRFSKNFLALMLFAVFGATLDVNAAAISAAQTGPWASTSTWTGGVVPGEVDDVTITGVTVTVSSSVNAKSIIVETSVDAVGKLIVQSGVALTVSTPGSPLVLKGGEVENTGTINLTTTGNAASYKTSIIYQNVGSGMLLNSGKYSGVGLLSLNCTTSTNGAGIFISQTDAEAIFTVGGTYSFSIPTGRPIFWSKGKLLIDGTGTITAGTSGTPASYGLIIMGANNAQITINPNVILSTYTSIATAKRGPIYLTDNSGITLTNKGTINIEGTGSNGIVSINQSSLSLINEGSINISGAFSESAIGINGSATGYFYIDNTGTVSISGLSASVPALGTPHLTVSSYLRFTNSTNGILDINAGSSGIATSGRSRIRNYGGTLKGSGVFNGGIETETGIISPGGDGIGKITIAQLQLLTANSNNLTGKCVMNVNGKTTAGVDYDQIVFNQGTVNVAGATLELNVDNSYTPADNDIISLFTVATRSGNFSSVTFPSLNWSMGYFYTDRVNVRYDTPASSTIASGNTVLISEATTIADLNISSGGALKVNPGKKLTLNGTFTNSGTLSLLSDNVNGTATLIDSYATPTVNATIQQYLPQGRNWYVASPIESTNAPASANSLKVAGAATSVSYYDETQNGTLNAWVNNYTGNMLRGVGYVAVSNSGTGTNNIELTGTLNSGDVPVTLTRTGTSGFAGYNLIANPYPSYINPMTAINTLNVEKTIWYRTKGSTYKFETVNTTTGVGTDAALSGNAVTGYIPPLQAFWVRTNANNVQLMFTNSMRTHANPLVGQTTINTTALKAPKQQMNSIVRININGNAGSDQAVLYFNSSASNSFDDFDSHKMFESSTATTPEIFTTVDNQKLAINGLNSILYDVEIPVGFVAKQAGDFSISRTEFSNFEAGTRIFLKDKLYPSTEFELAEGASYNFSSQPTTANTDRFSLIFRTPGVTTALETANKTNAQVFVNAANQIVIIAPEKSKYAIYSAVGQLMENGYTTAKLQTANYKLQTGIYVVKVNNQSTRVIIK